MNNKGVTQVLFFFTTIFILSSLISTGTSKDFLYLELGTAFKISFGLQLLSVLLCCLWMMLNLLSVSVELIDEAMSKAGRMYALITGGLVLLLNILALIVYPSASSQVHKTFGLSGEAEDSGFNVWCGLLAMGTLFDISALTVALFFEKKKKDDYDVLPN